MGVNWERNWTNEGGRVGGGGVEEMNESLT